MIAKTFKGGRTAKGARATIAYLLNERVGEGTAKVLRGDSELTQALINKASEKQAWSWSSGVLSFEETIDRSTAEAIMDDFERTFFAGLDKDQFNILWVQHTDKGRTELHYIAPRMELSTGLSYNPYFVKRDFAKKDLFQEYINLKYGLSSFKDSREVVPRPPKWRENAKKKDIRQAFDKALMPLVEEGAIVSREELIYQLEAWGFELNRMGKSYISVKDQGGNIHRLKGAIYAEDFTSWESVERKAEADRRTVANRVPRELTAIRAELDRIIEQQAFTNRERYARKTQQHRRRDQKRDGQDVEVGAQILPKDSRRREARVGRGVDEVEKTPANPFPHRPYLWLDSGRVSYPVLLPRPDNRSARSRHSGVPRWNAVRADQQDTALENNQEKRQVDDRTRAEAIRRVRAIRERTRRRAEALERAKEQLRAEHQRAIEQFSVEISRKLNEANTEREQRAKELDSILADANRTAEPNYQAIGATLQERWIRREVEQSFTAVIQAVAGRVQQLKRAFSARADTLAQLIRDRILKSVDDKTMQELNNFKTNINLAEFATAFGYYRDKEKSSINAPVMRHEDGDKIVIGRDRSDNHYIYFNPQDDSDNGTIIDFVQKRTGETLGHIRKRLRAWLRNPQPQDNIPVKSSSKDALRIANIWERIEGSDCCLTQFWGLSVKQAGKLARMHNVKYNDDERAFYFALSNTKGICGIEKRTADEKHIISGSEKGVFVTGNLREADRIFIFESPVDMISHQAMGLHNATDYTVSTMGSISESIADSLKMIFENNKEAEIIIAVDNDLGGHTIANKIASIAESVDGNTDRVKRQKPKHKDWNDDLKAEKQERGQRQTRSRGMGR